MLIFFWGGGVDYPYIFNLHFFGKERLIFFGESGVTHPKNSRKPSQYLPSEAKDNHNDSPVSKTDRQTFCYFIIRIAIMTL